MREASHRSRQKRSELFFVRQLDYPNQLDLAHEISFFAHAIGAPKSPSPARHHGDFVCRANQSTCGRWSQHDKDYA
jgi:hypothetical protein